MLRLLRVQFAGDLRPHEIPALRGAVAAHAGPENLLLHNHQPDGGLRYRYPLVQYQHRHGYPTLLALNDGVEAVQEFLQQPDWQLRFADGRPMPLQLHRLEVRQHRLHVTERPFVYQLHQWLALNQENFERYERTPGLGARLQLLEKLLTAHILSFATGVGWQVEAPLRVELLDLHPPRLVSGRDHRAMAFSGTFQVNAYLPDGIGLGRHVSLGYGTVRPPRRSQPAPAPTLLSASSAYDFD